MNASTYPRPPDLPGAFPVSDTDLAALHARLAARADAAGLLDLAYRTIDSPVGPLLLAATPAGLVRVAFASEDHDQVLAALASQISPRILNAPHRLDDVARELDEYFTGAAAALRPAAGLPADRRVPPRRAQPAAGHRLRPDGQLRPGRRRGRPARARCARPAPPAPPTRCRSSCRATG